MQLDKYVKRFIDLTSNQYSGILSSNSVNIQVSTIEDESFIAILQLLPKENFIGILQISLKWFFPRIPNFS